ncbi:Glyoxalase-like domain protein [Actinoalloteichus hoggarensis]|uniref:Glyoxalase-like domain protein n=1 Tax=Actinoalloteichus hoggarensis TaxID=1470176 RepID=A0A221W3T0_9PSEU|nr:Glyoxalase-like domain protein [Actinoalloteichus hoggarensis]
MPQENVRVNSAVRGVRRLELLTPDPVRSVEFHANLHQWVVLAQADDRFSCWVGERRTAHIRRPEPGETPGWHVVFGGGRRRGPRALTDVGGGLHAILDTGRVTHGPWAPEPREGEPCWTELVTADPPGSDTYWTTHAGWEFRPNPEPGTAVYQIEGRAIAGRRTAAAADHTAGWICHLASPNLTESLQRAVELGGRVAARPVHTAVGHTAAVICPDGFPHAMVENPGVWAGALAGQPAGPHPH